MCIHHDRQRKSHGQSTAHYVLLRERRNVTGLLYQAHVGMVESYVFDSRNISGTYLFFYLFYFSKTMST
jgi:hypothetical protein